jgi:hypothetical protein
MSLTNPPPAVTAFADMLIACSSVSAFGITSTSAAWYPSVDNVSTSSTSAAKPYVVIEESTHTRTRFAEAGATSTFGGELKATFVSDSKTTGEMEILGRAVVGELLALSTGLPLRSASAELSGEPDGAIRAADETDTAASYISIDVTVSYGLEA